MAAAAMPASQQEKPQPFVMGLGAIVDVLKLTNLLPQELERLSEVTTRAHLTAKPLARKLRSARYPVRLSAYGFALLHHQLQHHLLWLMLHLANSTLGIEVRWSRWVLEERKPEVVVWQKCSVVQG